MSSHGPLASIRLMKCVAEVVRRAPIEIEGMFIFSSSKMGL
jgi:hypothetical protein